MKHSSLILLFWSLILVCQASTMPTNSVNGRVVLTLAYPTNEITDDLFFNFYESTNLAPFTKWTFLTKTAATNFAPYQVVFDGTNWVATNLSAQLDIQPGSYFFVATSSNFWGETSITSNVVVTPPAPQAINGSLRIQKAP